MIGRAGKGLAPGERNEARPTGARLVASCPPHPGKDRRTDRRAHTILITLAILAITTVFALPTAPLRAQEPAPNANWYTLDTVHFRIHFTEELEGTARRAAGFAEASYALLSESFVDPPRGRIDIVLADNVDIANGAATFFPRNRIVAYVHPPLTEPQLAYHDDWLGLLILHELAHIFHLENAGDVWRGLRHFFGRNPALFPQAITPSWFVEGLATWIESEYTGAGRVRGSMFDMILRTAVLEDEFFPIDRVTIDPIRWPAGMSRYVYGGMFMRHLADRYGSGAVGDLVNGIGERIVPYRLDAASREAFGVSLTREWEIWADDLGRLYQEQADSVRARGLTEFEVLTFEGRHASHPRISPDGTTIAYAAAPGRSESAVKTLEAGSKPRRVAPTSMLGPPSWLPNGAGMIYAQLEFASPYDVYSELYYADVHGGAHRLTRGARVWEPDVSPDGRRAVVVQRSGATNVLAVFDLGTRTVEPLTEADPDVYWSGPRWSPDGSRIAAARWMDGNLDIVILEDTGRLLAHVTRDRAVELDPVWSPDGRYLLFSSDRTGITNLFAYEVESRKVKQVTNVLTGAFQPDIAPDGRWIAFSYYDADGYRIARMEFDPSQWLTAGQVRSTLEPVSEPAPADQGGAVRRYRAIETVGPTYWSPVVSRMSELGFGLGISTSGSDVVGRHLWNAAAVVYPSDRLWEAALGYGFRGWENPQLDVQITQNQVIQRASTAESPALLRRDREAVVSATLQRSRWRSLFWLRGAADIRRVEYFWDGKAYGGSLPRLPTELGTSAEIGFTSARSFGVSLGRQEGVQLSTRVDSRRFLGDRSAMVSPTSYWRIRSRGLLFEGIDLGGFAPSVLALRVNGGYESTTAGVGFTVGGGAGNAGVLPDGERLVGGRTAFPLRGYPSGTQGGDRAVAGSFEFRFPVALIERGFRLLPVGFDRIWGDLFVDAGAAWCPAGCEGPASRLPRSPDPLVSVGAETTLQLRLGYFLDVPVRLGVAVPLRAAGTDSEVFYIELSRSF